MESIGAMNIGEKTNPLRTFAICCKIWNHPDVLHKLHLNKESEMDLDLPDLQSTTGSTLSSTNKKRSSAKLTSMAPSPSIIEDQGFNPFGNECKRGMNGGFDPDWANKLMENYQPAILANGAKFSIAFQLIEESVRAGDKILLFSQSLLSLNLIEEYLQRLPVPNSTGQKWQKYKSYYR